MQSSQVSPRDVERANISFNQAVVAALTLGEIHLLDYSVEWLNGLLDNIGISQSFVAQYYRAFNEVVQEQLGFQAGPVLEWLSGFNEQ